MGNVEGSGDPTRALVCCHPTCTAFGISDQVQIFDITKQQIVQRIKVGNEQVPNVIRSIAFSPNGRFFAAAGDDKGVYVYDVETWTLAGTFKSQKKLSCIIFTPDSGYVLAANKYGDVLAARVPIGNDALLQSDMSVFMGHFCSIIMSLSISKVQKYLLASTDRDGRVRITALPKNMDDGAHDIVSFCLGHEKFVSSCSFIIDSDNKKELILTGGGDGLIKLWNPNTGDELDSKNVSGPILDMVASEEQSKCFVILDGSTEVVVVSVKDTMIHVVRQEIGIPAVTGVDVSDDGTTWFVGGPIGHSHGMRLMCMRWTDGTAESIDLIDQMREIENCTTDDKPLYLNHLPEYMEKKPRIFNK